jgi:hypothetical protein
MFSQFVSITQLMDGEKDDSHVTLMQPDDTHKTS